MSVGHPGFKVTSLPQSEPGGPAWEIAFLFPPQGQWSESEYLHLDRGGGKLVELIDGNLEVLAMPTLWHQKLVARLLFQLNTFVDKHSLGEAAFAPLPLHLRKDNYREPDVLFMRREHVAGRDYPERADLVVEVVSDDPESRKRDLVDKRQDYAIAGIPEYWIVDPDARRVTVLFDHRDGRYHAETVSTDFAKSVVIPGLTADLAVLFAPIRGA